MAKLKDLLKENFSIVGGVVGTPALGGNPFGKRAKLTNIVEDLYGQSEKATAKEVKEAIETFAKLGKLLQREENLKEIANQLSEIATKAKSYTLGETEDWFDKVTVNRNMKELTTLSKSFGKFAQEAQGLQERMSAVYEDMGHIVGRYYEIDDEDHVPGHEEDGDSIEEGDYEEFFKSAMDKFGISSPDELDDEKKKKFFNYVDKNYKAKSEGNVNEGKWAVNFELGMGAGDATIVVDANGKGQAKTLVAKQLKKGLKSIIGVKRVQSGFASQMDKKLGDD
tara:strand:- start:391 stop:1233 length:843 start_codon:yes stop_codon:yes gene_type:complete